MEKRSSSADDLLASGKDVNRKLTELTGRVERLASGVTAVDVYSEYESLFKQYESALAQYEQHRRQYFEHVQAYHSAALQPPMIAPDDDDGSDATNVPNWARQKALKYSTENKCAQLQNLEAQIIFNEQRLQTMLDNLVASQPKESASIFASDWTQTQQLALKNNAMATQFNHLGLLKTATYSHNVHSLIEAANRDGAYNEHIQAYRDLSTSNNIQNELYKRSNSHSQFSVMVLSRLKDMQPRMAQNVGPAPGTAVTYSALDLSRESNGLDNEYANLQSLLQKLEVVRKAMPPSFRPGTKSRN